MRFCTVRNENSFVVKEDNDDGGEEEEEKEENNNHNHCELSEHSEVPVLNPTLKVLTNDGARG